jgi:hypothetical protein
MLLAVAFGGCQTARKQIESKRDYIGLPTTDFTLTVVCSSPDMAFNGTIVDDGEPQEVSGVCSGTYRISAHHLVCSFMRSGTNGTFVFTILVGGPEQSSSSTGTRLWDRGVRADFLRTPSAQYTRLKTF